MKHEGIKAMVLGAALSAAGWAGMASAAPDEASAGKEFGWLVAKWRCDEKWAQSEFAPAYDSTSTLTASSEVDGVWLTWTYIQDPSEKNPHPPKGADIWGYDPQKKEFLREKVDSFAPGKVTHLTTPGWKGDTLTWDGQAGTPKGMKPFRHTFKKLDERSIEMHVYIDGHPVYAGKCTKP